MIKGARGIQVLENVSENCVHKNCVCKNKLIEK